jgi:hypothetical protein
LGPGPRAPAAFPGAWRGRPGAEGGQAQLYFGGWAGATLLYFGGWVGVGGRRFPPALAPRERGGFPPHSPRSVPHRRMSSRPPRSAWPYRLPRSTSLRARDQPTLPGRSGTTLPVPGLRMRSTSAERASNAAPLITDCVELGIECWHRMSRNWRVVASYEQPTAPMYRFLSLLGRYLAAGSSTLGGRRAI